MWVGLHVAATVRCSSSGPGAHQPVEGRGDQRFPVVVADPRQHEQEGAQQVRRRRDGAPGRRRRQSDGETPAAAAAAFAGEMWQRRELRGQFRSHFLT